jgi:tRNA guanosine-2'-O-methyltransferase
MRNEVRLLSNMTSTQPAIRTLLDRIPPPDRTQVVRDAIASVKLDDPPGASVALSLLAAQWDHESEQQLLGRLYASIVAGHAGAAFSATEEDPNLRVRLLHRVVRQLLGVAYHLEKLPKSELPVSLLDVASLPGWGHVPDPSLDHVVPLLRFLKLALSPRCDRGDLKFLVAATLNFLGVADESICLAARDVVSILTSGAFPCIREGTMTLWPCAQALIQRSSGPFHIGLGFAIWLRWASCADLSRALRDPTYSTLLRRGLLEGDGERRKQCLGILRLSVAHAAEAEDTRAMICSDSATATSKSSFPVPSLARWLMNARHSNTTSWPNPHHWESVGTCKVRNMLTCIQLPLRLWNNSRDTVLSSKPSYSEDISTRSWNAKGIWTSWRQIDLP